MGVAGADTEVGRSLWIAELLADGRLRLGAGESMDAPVRPTSFDDPDSTIVLGRVAAE